jgi:hypothetical protein
LAKLSIFSRKARVALDWLLELLLPPDVVQLPILPGAGTKSKPADEAERPQVR